MFNELEVHGAPMTTRTFTMTNTGENTNAAYDRAPTGNVPQSNTHTCTRLTALCPGLPG